MTMKAIIHTIGFIMIIIDPMFVRNGGTLIISQPTNCVVSNTIEITAKIPIIDRILFI